jgi:sulfur carrier protein ThiS
VQESHKALVPHAGLRVNLRRIGPEKGEQVVELQPGAVVADALRAAGIVPETVLVARADHTVVPDDEPLADGDELLVTRVVTGG